jgi:hypothetical protein
MYVLSFQSTKNAADQVTNYLFKFELYLDHQTKDHR